MASAKLRPWLAPGGSPGLVAGVPEVSVVMPCLNEARTVGICISKARRALEACGAQAEVIVANNASQDGSAEVAERLLARIVHVPAKGYGLALMAGIAISRGRYVIIGDADDSYDFSAIEPFVLKLRGGYDLVVGNRFAGGIADGAMPWLRRFVGNPVLSGLGCLLFGGTVRDFHCGLRGFSRSAYDQLGLSSPGMEFASEMVIKATLLGLRATEVPIVLHKDGRGGPSHLRPWRDGWRHLRLMLRLWQATPKPRVLLGRTTTFD